MTILFALLLGCPASPPTADDYCETTAESFCDYYLRCGRIAEDTPEACQATFVEVCNGVYEPHYTALEREGLLMLSPEGIEACTDHLETVQCEQQVFDLDGDCGQMWQGLVPSGGECGLGIESFVCEPGSECVLSLDFCGTCEPSEPDERGNPGDACSEDDPCRLGTTCIEEVCAGPTIVEVGDPCDAQRRCPYRSECVSGTCVRMALQGEACGDGVACASGWCEGDTCSPLKDDGDTCGGAVECVSRTCTDDVCGELPGVCFE